MHTLDPWLTAEGAWDCSSTDSDGLETTEDYLDYYSTITSDDEAEAEAEEQEQHLDSPCRLEVLLSQYSRAVRTPYHVHPSIPCDGRIRDCDGDAERLFQGCHVALEDFKDSVDGSWAMRKAFPIIPTAHGVDDVRFEALNFFHVEEVDCVEILASCPCDDHAIPETVTFLLPVENVRTFGCRAA